jgi:hypothetical protein
LPPSSSVQRATRSALHAAHGEEAARRSAHRDP